MVYPLRCNQTDLRRIGQRAEETACRFLQRRGLQLLARNYRCVSGEIDLIMRDQLDMVFVEVRYRARQDYGMSAETVTAHKQRKLIKTAHHYLQRHTSNEVVACRFDVIAITQRQFRVAIEWIKDAFQVSHF